MSWSWKSWAAMPAGLRSTRVWPAEIPFDLEVVAARLRERESWGARFSIVVVAEGACPIGGTVSLITGGDAATAERLGGLSARVAERLEKLTGKETRYVVLGHLQRGGTPTSHDRDLATRFAGKAVECVLKHEFDVMVASQPPDIVTVPLETVVGKQKRVPPEFDLIRTARAIGISFGEASQSKN